jgi:Cd2+/Zn2+-exporting ATPase
MNYSRIFFSRQFIWEIVRIVVVGLASLLFYLEIIPACIISCYGIWPLLIIKNSDP